MLAIEKLNYAYPDGHQAIRDVNLKIEEGKHCPGRSQRSGKIQLVQTDYRYL